MRGWKHNVETLTFIKITSLEMPHVPSEGHMFHRMEARCAIPDNNAPLLNRYSISASNSLPISTVCCYVPFLNIPIRSERVIFSSA